LPSGSELEVNIWRLWDGGRARVWYEWSAEVYLPLSVGLAFGVGGGGGVERIGGGSGLSPVAGRSVSQSGGAPSPMMDAPFSPGLLPNGGILGGGGGIVGGGDGRVKIGQTSLHNPGGVHSWIGL